MTPACGAWLLPCTPRGLGRGKCGFRLRIPLALDGLDREYNDHLLLERPLTRRLRQSSLLSIPFRHIYSCLVANVSVASERRYTHRKHNPQNGTISNGLLHRSSSDHSQHPFDDSLRGPNAPPSHPSGLPPSFAPL